MMDRERLVQKLQGRRGHDFVEALIDELVSLQERLHEAEATMRQLDVFAAYADRMATLNAAAAASAVPLMDTYEVTADQFFAPEVNIYGLEYTSDGTAYRWTGPELDTTFLIPLDRSVQLRMILDFVVGEGREEKLPLTVLIDGRGVKYEVVEGSRIRLMATLPPRYEQVETAATAITIAVRETVQPSNEDSRRLGIGFFGLSVLPERKTKETAAHAATIFG